VLAEGLGERALQIPRFLDSDTFDAHGLRRRLNSTDRDQIGGGAQLVVVAWRRTFRLPALLHSQ